MNEFQVGVLEERGQSTYPSAPEVQCSKPNEICDRAEDLEENFVEEQRMSLLTGIEGLDAS